MSTSSSNAFSTFFGWTFAFVGFFIGLDIEGFTSGVIMALLGGSIGAFVGNVVYLVGMFAVAVVWFLARQELLDLFLGFIFGGGAS